MRPKQRVRWLFLCTVIVFWYDHQLSSHFACDTAIALQDDASSGDPVAVSLGGADYDWNRWDGHIHCDTMPSTLLKAPKQPRWQLAKHWRRKPEKQKGKQAAVDAQQFAVSIPAETMSKGQSEAADTKAIADDNQKGRILM